MCDWETDAVAFGGDTGLRSVDELVTASSVPGDLCVFGLLRLMASCSRNSVARSVSHRLKHWLTLTLIQTKALTLVWSAKKTKPHARRLGFVRGQIEACWLPKRVAFLHHRHRHLQNVPDLRWHLHWFCV